jgi:hypothetical protein
MTAWLVPVRACVVAHRRGERARQVAGRPRLPRLHRHAAARADRSHACCGSASPAPSARSWSATRTGRPRARSRWRRSRAPRRAAGRDPRCLARARAPRHPHPGVRRDTAGAHLRRRALPSARAGVGRLRRRRADHAVGVPLLLRADLVRALPRHRDLLARRAALGWALWAGIAHWQTRPLVRYLAAASGDGGDAGEVGNATSVYRLAQALPYRLAAASLDHLDRDRGRGRVDRALLPRRSSSTTRSSAWSRS